MLMPTPSPAPRFRHSCRFHCAACDRHFLSLRAFDLHRSGPYSARVCLDPAELPERFRVLSDDGVCKISGPEHVHAQTVWGLEGIDSSRLAELKGREGKDDDAPEGLRVATPEEMKALRSQSSDSLDEALASAYRASRG